MSNFPEGDSQGMSLKVSKRAHRFWRRLMQAKHDSTEDVCLGVFLKVKITVDILTASFLESDYIGMSLKNKMT